MLFVRIIANLSFLRSIFCLIIISCSTNVLMCQSVSLTKLKASDGAMIDYFGGSVAMSESHLVVGAFGDKDYGWYSGAAYVYKKDLEGNWVDEQKLISPDTFSDQRYGYAVGISGDYVFVGAPLYNGFKGVVHVYKVNDSGLWDYHQRLDPPDVSLTARFGEVLSVSGENLAINFLPQSILMGGAVCTYKRDSLGFYQLEQTIIANPEDDGEGEIYNDFGDAISISDNYLIIGDPDDAIDEGTNCDGSVYFYEMDSLGIWSNVQKVKAFEGDVDNEFRFGSAVDIYNDVAIVRSRLVPDDIGTIFIYQKNNSTGWEFVQKLYLPFTDSYCTFCDINITSDYLVVGNMWDKPANVTTGSAYIYRKMPNGLWGDEILVYSSNGGSGDWFGESVAVLGDNFVFGATGDSEIENKAGAIYYTSSSLLNNNESVYQEVDPSLKIYPNPTSGGINITFHLKESTQVQFVLNDLNGKCLSKTELSLPAGFNEQELNIPYKGFMYFSLKSDYFTTTKRIYVID